MSEHKSFQFSIPGQPMGWKRAGKNKWTGATFDPKENQDYKKRVRDYAFEAGIRGEPHAGPVCLTVTAYLQRPKKFFRQKDPDGPIHCTSKPDLDNIVKLIEDAMNKYVYRDDAQVCYVTLGKFYCEKSGRPRTAISIELLPEV